jgi:hypothetical protein
VAREIPSRRLARQVTADNVEVVLVRGEVGVWLIDLAQGKRVFGVVGHAPSLLASG